MTIDEAIAHCLEVAENCEEQAKQCDSDDRYERHVMHENAKCAAEKRQLATWLKELKEALELIQEYKTENAKLREFNDKIYDVLAKQFGSPCNCNYVVDEYMRKNGGCDDCGVEISDKECWSRYIQTKLIGDEQ